MGTSSGSGDAESGRPARVGRGRSLSHRPAACHHAGETRAVCGVAESAGADQVLRTYVLKRIGFAALMLLGVSIVLFGIMRLAPGGPEAVLIGGEFSPEAAAQIRQRLGLDRPLVLQYLAWARAAARGDLGQSFKTGDSVTV